MTMKITAMLCTISFSTTHLFKPKTNYPRPRMLSKALMIDRIDCSEERQQKYFACQFFTYRSIIKDLSLQNI